MLEKSSAVILTEDDLEKFRNGIVSDRVKENWEFTLDQLSEVVNKNEYKAITK